MSEYIKHSPIEIGKTVFKAVIQISKGLLQEEPPLDMSNLSEEDQARVARIEHRLRVEQVFGPRRLNNP